MRKAADLLRERADDDRARCMTAGAGQAARRGQGARRWPAPTSSTGSPRKAAAPTAASSRRAPRACYQLVIKEPVGPVAAFTPWNFPINQVVRKLVGGARRRLLDHRQGAGGDAGRAAPSWSSAFADAGVPAGVLSLVYGDPAEISEYLIPHPVIRKITFTGSTPVGKQLAALAGQHMKRVTMELGGHAPVIVFDDADVDAGGRSCWAPPSSATPARSASRRPASWCTRSVYDEFVDGVRRRTPRALKVGDGLEPRHADGPAGQPAPPRRRWTAFIADAHGQGRQGAHRRRAHRQPGQLLRADRADRRAAATPGS